MPIGDPPERAFLQHKEYYKEIEHMPFSVEEGDVIKVIWEDRTLGGSIDQVREDVAIVFCGEDIAWAVEFTDGSRGFIIPRMIAQGMKIEKLTPEEIIRWKNNKKS
jgi:hypothetical protein